MGELQKLSRAELAETLDRAQASDADALLRLAEHACAVSSKPNHAVMALALCEKVAGLGDLRGSHILAECALRSGQPLKAEHHFRRLAKAGCPKSMGSLAGLLLRRGSPDAMAEAVTWLAEAESLGNETASHALADLQFDETVN